MPVCPQSVYVGSKLNSLDCEGLRGSTVAVATHSIEGDVISLRAGNIEIATSRGNILSLLIEIIEILLFVQYHCNGQKLSQPDLTVTKQQLFTQNLGRKSSRSSTLDYCTPFLMLYVM